ncbi:MAG: MATE family efflux transporter [Clostridia bacterium]|nr:MATE family efflux transporter [Clostridia bacterium]
MHQDLTKGPILQGLLRFSLPLMAGNLLQQTYNLVDTWVVGRYCGQEALAAVGSAFSVMVLLTSIITGLCMGSGVVVSQLYGQGDHAGMRRAVGNALTGITAVTLLLTALAYVLLPSLMSLMNIPSEAQDALYAYLSIVFAGILPTFLYNFAAAILRAVGNSAAPLLFLLLSTLTNIGLDLLFVPALRMGVAGAAWATLIAQVLSAAVCAAYFLLRAPHLIPNAGDLRPQAALCRRIFAVSALTSVQQSIMNFGILMVQSLVNSFGVEAMAAFAAGVKIDAFAYAPAQDFGNGFGTFVAQNAGAGQQERLRRGLRTALIMVLAFCFAVSVLVGIFAKPLLLLFLDSDAPQALAIGLTYLRTEGLCYIGIGVLFLLYATWRGMERAGMSVVLTITSLGLRVALAYAFAPTFGLMAVWLAIPIGWAAADAIGLIGLRRIGVLRRSSVSSLL